MANDYDVSAAFKAIENELIASMIRNMDRHRAEETKEGYNWSMWQTEQLKALEKYKRRNRRLFDKRFKDINSRIDGIIRQSRLDGNLAQEIQILKAVQRGYRFPRAPEKLLELLEELDGKTFRQKASILLKKMRGQETAKGTAEFFKLNDRKMDALITATKKDFEKAEYAVLRMANDQYRKAIFNAQVYANSGAGTYEKAVDMATKDMLSRGLNCVEYANGARHTLPDYADMAIKTASKRAYLQGEGEVRREWGLHLVIMNKRGNPCPKCLPWVGKVLIDDVWSGGRKADGPYSLMSAAIAAELYHPRCRDSHTTYFPGLSTADGTWTPEELEAVERASKKESKRQYAERQADKFNRLAKYSLDTENKKEYSRKAEEWKGVAKAYRPDIIKLSDEEFGAIQKYKSSESYIINDAIRRAKDITMLSPEKQQFVKELDSALSKIKTYDGNLIRTVNFSDWPDSERRTEKFLKEFLPGKTIKTKEYWSASKELGYDDEAGIRIFIQDAKKGRDISDIGLDEKEVLYERESSFAVVAREYKDGAWNILLREV